MHETHSSQSSGLRAAAAKAPPREFNPQAAVLAWLWPGLGHISLGQKRRGLMIMFGVLFLVVCGVLVGGIDSVDRIDDRLWFYAQSLCGPLVLGIDLLNQIFLKNLPEESREHVTGLARVNEMGTLFIALAGLMNLVVILDALHFAPRPSEPLPAQPKRRAGDRRAESDTGSEA